MEKEKRSAEKIETDIPLEMYEISGQDPITEHSFNRYRECQKEDKAIEEEAEIEKIEKSMCEINNKIRAIPEEKRSKLIREGLNHLSPRVQRVYSEMIWLAPEKEQASLRGMFLQKIIEGLKNEDARTRKLCAEAIIFSQILYSDRVLLIKEGFSCPDIEVQRIVGNMIFEAPEEEQESLGKLALEKIKEGLENPDIKVQKTAMTMTWFVPLAERTALVREGLSHKNIEVQKVAVEMIKFVPKQDAVSLIKEALDNQNVEIWGAVIQGIKHVPIEEREALWQMFSQKIKEGLNSHDSQVQEVVADIIYMVPERKRVIFIEDALNHPNPEVGIIVTGKFWSVSDEEKKYLEGLVLKKVKKDLESPDIKVFKAAAEMRTRAPREELALLTEMTVTRLRKELESPDIETWKMFTEHSHLFPTEERVNLIKSGLNNQNIEIQKMAVKIIKYMPKKERDAFLDLIAEKGLADEIIKPHLYEKKDIDKKKFSRQAFEKTGSETILIGGDLMGKTIIRQIEPKAFLAWKELYNDYAFWQEQGFDYVPIEPIQSYKLNENGLVDVFSGVLDISLGEWRRDLELDRFTPKLQEQKNKIRQVLDKRGIKHGHDHHDYNFCLRFFRDENGKPDLKRMPRLYLIDFDQAVSP
ncbi:MAG: hypothetical protein WC242_00620 [Candidatus Paceibacterota bacterium]|jgi:hypothetical protein